MPFEPVVGRDDSRDAVRVTGRKTLHFAASNTQMPGDVNAVALSFPSMPKGDGGGEVAEQPPSSYESSCRTSTASRPSLVDGSGGGGGHRASASPSGRTSTAQYGGGGARAAGPELSVSALKVPS